MRNFSFKIHGESKKHLRESEYTVQSQMQNQPWSRFFKKIILIIWNEKKIFLQSINLKKIFNLLMNYVANH